MAVEVETKGQLQEFIDVLFRRRWHVILPAAIVLSIGVLVAVIVPKKYVARTQVELRPVGISISSKEAANAPFQIRSHNRVTKVVKELQNREYLSLEPADQGEFITGVLDDIKVTLGKGATEATNFVTIEYSDVQLSWALDFTKKLRDDWIQDVVERDRRKSEDELKKLFEERLKLEKQHAREEQALTALRRTHGLSATQPVPGSTSERTEDPVFERLRRNETEKAALERSQEQAKAKLAQMQKRYDELPPMLSRSEAVPGVSNQEELAGVEREIRDAEEKLSGLKPANSQFKKIKDQLGALERKREALTRLITKGGTRDSTVPNPALLPLRKEIEALEDEVTEKRALVAQLTLDIERDQARNDELQGVYTEVRQRAETIARLTQSLSDAERRYREKQTENELLKSALAVPFELTQDVTSSGKPTEPNPWLIVSFAIFAGLGIGLGLALLSEYSKSSFRGVADISRVMVVPVLGRIDAIETRRQARARTIRRLAVGASSAVFVCSVLFVTWAWAKSPDLLSRDLRDTIESVRAKMR